MDPLSPLFKTSEWLNLFGEALAGILYDWDVSSGIVTRTDGLTSILGYSPEEVSAYVSWWNEHIHPDDLKKVEEAFLNATNFFQVEYRVRKKDGSYLYILDRALIIRDESGEVKRLVGTNIDITKRKDVEEHYSHLWQSEKLARERAENANRAKDEFLAIVSHELRSPLQAILGWIKLIRNNKLDPETSSKAYETIERNTQAQIKLITDLLDVSRFITGKIKLKLSSLNLTDLVQSSIDSLRPTALNKNIKIDSDLGLKIPIINGDVDRINQVLWNLLTNAVKFTPHGGQISIETTQVDHEVLITIADTGIGISEEFLPKVFDRFQQADSSDTKSHGGLGLGLAIAKQIIELHGGSIGVKSEGLNKGSAFTIRLPIGQLAETSNKVNEKQIHSLDSLKQIKILVVDDETDTRDVISTALRAHGAEVLAVESAEDALVSFDLFNPQVVVSDLGMPHQNGFSLMQELRKNSSNQHFRAIALSALTRENDKKRAIDAGFDKHVPKPADPDKLISAIQDLLQI